MAEQLAPIVGHQAEVVAGLLIGRFGTISRVFGASNVAIASTLHDYPDQARAICAARELAIFAAREILVGEVVIANDRRLHDYLSIELQNPLEERMHVIFLNRDGRYLAGETISRGTPGKLIMRVRDVVHRALDLGANRLLMAHNHPSGCCIPSEEDYRSTEAFATIAETLDLAIEDHLIVSSDGIFSMRQGSKL